MREEEAGDAGDLERLLGREVAARRRVAGTPGEGRLAEEEIRTCRQKSERLAGTRVA